jgi:hypothetical protein
MMAMRNCPVCKKSLPSTMGANARYCSAACRAKRARDSFIWSHLAGDTVQRLKVARRLAS